MNMQRQGSEMSMCTTNSSGNEIGEQVEICGEGLQRSTTGMSTASTQAVPQDIEGGQEAIFSEDKPYPVLGFGFCSARGRRPYNEDRLMIAPRMNGSDDIHTCI